MTKDILVLAGTAASIGFIHTLTGPDHYLPFIAMAKARKWSLLRTTVITLLCGIGHVLSSVVLGFVGIFLGTVVLKLESVEAFRGDLAGWFLIAFGLVYSVWGVRRALRGKPHQHLHLHEDSGHHSHNHDHTSEHAHVHDSKRGPSLTPWVLFTIFVFGPCEPLIPLIMSPAAESSVAGVVVVALVFGVVTIGTMLASVFAGVYGLSWVSWSRAERWSHAMAGGTIFLCGASIKFLGL